MEVPYPGSGRSRPWRMYFPPVRVRVRLYIPDDGLSVSDILYIGRKKRRNVDVVIYSPVRWRRIQSKPRTH